MNNKICGECCHLERAEHFSVRCKHCSGTVSSSNTACDHFSKRYGFCPECGSYLFSYEHTKNNDWQLCTCDRCGCSGTPEEFLYNSGFARIMESPEVLATKLVYDQVRCDKEGQVIIVWRSTITDDIYYTKQAAITATVAKLKEVEEQQRVKPEEITDR